MKQITKLLLGAGLVLAVAACEKTDDLPLYKTGNAVTLSSSSNSVAAAPSDSDKTVITYSWTSPNYATDSSTVKYIVEIDSAGRNFSKAVKKTVSGTLSTGFTGKEINAILIGYGFNIGTAYDMDVRVTSSYANNNDQYKSNVIKMKMTPYKIPPKIPVPAELIMVGDATLGGWDNPASNPAQAIAQRFSLIDETTYAGVFFLNGGGQYLMLPKSGNWDHKFGGASKTGGPLLVDGAVPSSNTPAPDADGYYLIVVDFQKGEYKVTPFTMENGLPAQLVMVGGATPGGWSNEVSNTQKFTRLNSVEFTQTINLKANDFYLILPVAGSWDKKYGCPDKNDANNKLGGTLKPQGDDIPSPTEAASYKVTVNFATAKYKLVKQ